MMNVQYEIPSSAGPRLVPGRLVGRIGGLGGLVFAASVIAQNVIRASGMPANDASADKIIEFYADGRGATWALALLFPLGAAGLVTFVAALASRTGSATGRIPTVAGTIGAAAVYAGYTMVLATDLGLSGYVHRGSPNPEIVSALWIMHNAVFGVLLMGIAMALAGLSTAAAGAGVVNGAWQRVGLVGAVALAIAAAATPATIDGSPVLVLGLLGFLTWVAFVASAAVGLLKGNQS